MDVPVASERDVAVTWSAAGATDRGRRRRRNEDSLLLEPGRGLYAVADGMGGHAAGDVASRIATAVLSAEFRRAASGDGRPDDRPAGGGEATDVAQRRSAAEERLAAAFEVVNRSILEHATSHPQCSGMGTTLTCLATVAPAGCVVAHMGDSRAYLLRGGVLTQVTRDHTWVQEQVDAGVLTAMEARTHRLASVLSRVLGTPDVGAPDVLELDAEPGDRWLLCSDGLSSMVADAVLLGILLRERDADVAVAALIAAANDAGGADNITAIVLDVHG